MTAESGNGFRHRHRWALALAVPVVAVVVLVLAYRATTPKSAQTTTASGERVSGSEVLQVGALPVT